MLKFQTVNTVFLGLLVAALAVGDAVAEYDWRTIIKEDIWYQHSCRVTFFSHIVERQTENGTVVLAKVHCEDKRSFDATQFGTHEPFSYSECTPREKKSC